ncbi:MAG TPA: thioredoxin-dependent thiol peroxidase [Chitinophagales bacterium]|nr:thioredoxin-dependent thiol peroxidase [Chitinophagales bacterium]
MLEVGDQLPDVAINDQNGQLVNLRDFKGEKMIVFFYPKNNTPGCTNEVCNFRDNYSVLKEKGFKIIGTSPDNEKSHTKFKEKHELPYTLLADTDKLLANAFGVWGPKKFMGKSYEGIHRTTFIVDAEGVISHVIKKVKTKESTEQILKLLEE